MTTRLLEMMDIGWATPSRRERIVGKVIAATLQDLDRLHEFEDELRPVDGEELTADLPTLEILWTMFEDWAVGAEWLMLRLDPETASAEPGAALRRAINRVRARLTVRPAEISNAIAMAAAGNNVKGEDLRSELRDRMGH